MGMVLGDFMNYLMMVWKGTPSTRKWTKDGVRSSQNRPSALLIVSLDIVIVLILVSITN